MPTIVICIANNKTGENEKGIDSQITVIDKLFGRSAGVSFKKVEQYDQ